MKLKTRFPKNVFGMAIVCYSVAVVFIFCRLYFLNYSAAVGNVLPNGREVGADFVSFFVAGKLATGDHSKLYDFSLQLQEERKLFIGSGIKLGTLPFAYPPLVALVFSFFANFSLIRAYLIWSAVSLALFVLSVRIVSRVLGLRGRESAAVSVVAMGFTPFVLDCLGSGQTSCFGLAIYAGIVSALEMRAKFLAGLLLGIGYYKPPLFVFFSLGMLVSGQWTLLAGALLSGLALILGTVSWFGLSNSLEYLSQARLYSYGHEFIPGVSMPTSRGLGLYAILNEHLGAGTPTANLLFAVILLLALSLPRILARTRFEQNERLALAAQISLSLFFSLQMVVYDLTILIVPFILFYQSAKKWNLSGIRAIATVALVGLYLEWLTRGPELDFTCARLSFALWCGSILALALTEREERPIPS